MRFLTLGTEPQTYRRACQHLHHTPATVLPARTCCALLLPPLDLDLPALLRQLRLLLQLRANPGSLADQPAGRHRCVHVRHWPTGRTSSISAWISAIELDRTLIVAARSPFRFSAGGSRHPRHPPDPRECAHTSSECSHTRVGVSLVTVTLVGTVPMEPRRGPSEALRDCLMPTGMTRRARRGGSKVAPGAVHELQREERAASSSKA